MNGDILVLKSGASGIKFALYVAAREPARVLSTLREGRGTT